MYLATSEFETPPPPKIFQRLLWMTPYLKRDYQTMGNQLIEAIDLQTQAGFQLHSRKSLGKVNLG